MRYHRRKDDPAEYPDEMRRTILEVLGVNRGHVSLAILGLLCGGLEHFHISDSSERVVAVEKTAERHGKALAVIVERLGKIDTAIAVQSGATAASTEQIHLLVLNVQDLTKAVYRMEGMGPSKADLSLAR